MLQFEGQKDFPQTPPATAFEKLADAQFLVQCVPDVHEILKQEPKEATLTLRPGFAFIRGTIEVAIQVAETVAPASIKLDLHSKGVGTSSDIEVRLQLAPQEQGTRVTWTIDVKHLGGLLKMVPKGLIKGAAQKVVADAWARAEKLLTPTA